VGHAVYGMCYNDVRSMFLKQIAIRDGCHPVNDPTNLYLAFRLCNPWCIVSVTSAAREAIRTHHISRRVQRLSMARDSTDIERSTDTFVKVIQFEGRRYECEMRCRCVLTSVTSFVRHRAIRLSSTDERIAPRRKQKTSDYRPIATMK